MTTAALQPLSHAARFLNVPSTWLRAEAEAGRIPHLRAGRAFLFDLDLVEQLLIQRARCKPDAAGREEARDA
jgi:excisionase family DNA binding protein